ncbi:hypothetical protein B9Z65_2172 [Elsinoe australis]|uniref:Uncharacterized protein n=1 Tax=Elsinoe australis TaxID=40998 RepID=A0A2P7YNA9_9PEZI|nr:hypothetical protein B9Z65_2172 [Elsinoe australis]
MPPKRLAPGEERSLSTNPNTVRERKRRQERDPETAKFEKAKQADNEYLRAHIKKFKSTHPYKSAVNKSDQDKLEVEERERLINKRKQDGKWHELFQQPSPANSPAQAPPTWQTAVKAQSLPQSDRDLQAELEDLRKEGLMQDISEDQAVVEKLTNNIIADFATPDHTEPFKEQCKPYVQYRLQKVHQVWLRDRQEAFGIWRTARSAWIEATVSCAAKVNYLAELGDECSNLAEFEGLLWDFFQTLHSGEKQVYDILRIDKEHMQSLESNEQIYHIRAEIMASFQQGVPQLCDEETLIGRELRAYVDSFELGELDINGIGDEDDLCEHIATILNENLPTSFADYFKLSTRTLKPSDIFDEIEINVWRNMAVWEEALLGEPYPGPTYWWDACSQEEVDKFTALDDPSNMAQITYTIIVEDPHINRIPKYLYDMIGDVNGPRPLLLRSAEMLPSFEYHIQHVHHRRSLWDQAVQDLKGQPRQSMGLIQFDEDAADPADMMEHDVDNTDE